MARNLLVDAAEIQLKSKIGGGSCSLVHEVVWRGAQVAVKVIQLPSVDTQERKALQEQCKREAKMLVYVSLEK